MNMFIHLRLGHYLQDEAGGDGGDGGGAAPAPAADAPADAKPAAEPAATAEGSSLFGIETPEELAAKQEAEKKANEQKTEEQLTKEADEKAAKEKAEKDALGAPETYEAFKAPEGVEIAEEVMPDVQALFKDLNLPQDKAQEVFEKLLGLQERINGTPEEQMQRAEQQIIALNTSMAEQCKSLPGIGGEKFGESLATASKVMQQFGTPELRSLIALTGVGSHPEFFKMMVAIGSKMSPDTFERGGEEPQVEKSAAKAMFGHLFEDK